MRASPNRRSAGVSSGLGQLYSHFGYVVDRGDDVPSQAVGVGEQRVHAFSLFSPFLPVKNKLQEQELKVCVAGGAGGGEVVDEFERFDVVALAAGGGASGWRDERGAEIGDE